MELNTHDISVLLHSVGCVVLYFISSLVIKFRQELKQVAKQASKQKLGFWHSICMQPFARFLLYMLDLMLGVLNWRGDCHCICFGDPLLKSTNTLSGYPVILHFERSKYLKAIHNNLGFNDSYLTKGTCSM